jgi:Holliday junction resolvase-like predicted endonuclease
MECFTQAKHAELLDRRFELACGECDLTNAEHHHPWNLGSRFSTNAATFVSLGHVPN